MKLPGLQCPRCGEYSGVSYLQKCLVYVGQIFMCANCNVGLEPNWMAVSTSIFLGVLPPHTRALDVMNA
jgi:hypothetical protein